MGVRLACGPWRIDVDTSICEVATPRVHWAAFLAPPDDASPAVLVIRRRASLDGERLEAPLGTCTYRLSDDLLEVCFEDGSFRAELVLRLGWYLVITRMGGVLVHASAVSDGTAAVVAAGQSGDGKSTLGRLCVEAGLTLLTDEVVGLLPDGRVSGTPFRSDFESVGSPMVRPARYLFALEKGASEALKPLPALEAVQLAMAQCFEVAELALPRAEVRRRLLSFLSHVEPRTLSFRKHPDAGAFVAALLRGEAMPGPCSA